MPVIYTVDPEKPEPVSIGDAARCLAGGGVVVFPTRCLYGLAVDALNPNAVEKIFRIKGRSPQKPILILVAGMPALERVVYPPGPASLKLAHYFWPGRVTIIFKALPALPANLSAGTGHIGVRLPSHPVARAFVSAAKGPITGTSANLAGRPGCSTISSLDPALVDQVDMVLDAGPLKGGAGSTVVDAQQTPPQVLREGTVSTAEITAVLD
jgi:L-threonylcarbamoyladenylate synthase